MRLRSLFTTAILLSGLSCASYAFARGLDYGDQPAITPEIDTHQADIDRGRFTFAQLFARGSSLFQVAYNRLDGHGDPKRSHLRAGQPFLRFRGLDSQSCLECHNSTGLNAALESKADSDGGAGGFVATAFNLQGVSPSVASRGTFRNPPSTFGNGYIELLAKEMSNELHTQRDAALALAKSSGQTQSVALRAKGVSFGQIVVYANGRIDSRQVQGVDHDLTVKPFGWKGHNRTIREMTTEAANFHFGMEPSEIVGVGVDHDGDGVKDELSVGNVSAITLYVAYLRVPQQDLNELNTEAIGRGEKLFATLQCAQCHIPNLPLKDSVFTLLDPLNPSQGFSRDLTERQGSPAPTIPQLRRAKTGDLAVPLYSDLKRHNLGPGLAEDISMKSVSGETIARELFRTPALWGVGDTGPWLHDGRATTLGEAIQAHGGEAAASRKLYLALPEADRQTVVEFLKSLRLPETAR